MYHDHDPRLSRRALLKAAVGVASAATLGGINIAQAQAKMAPNLVMYQDTPKDGHQCDGCVQFKSPDSCLVVEGKISPKGWCAAWAPKAQ